jgi:predicted RNase H-like HicB family nuclease
MEKLHLPVIIEVDENDYYIVSCPLFKGCHSYGETIDEALVNIREVIEMCLEETKIEEAHPRLTQEAIQMPSALRIEEGFIS